MCVYQPSGKLTLDKLQLDPCETVEEFSFTAVMLQLCYTSVEGHRLLQHHLGACWRLQNLGPGALSRPRESEGHPHQCQSSFLRLIPTAKLRSEH